MSYGRQYGKEKEQGHGKHRGHERSGRMQANNEKERNRQEEEDESSRRLDAEIARKRMGWVAPGWHMGSTRLAHGKHQAGARGALVIVICGRAFKMSVN